ncbi:MarR family winged helix-turn-helix transcriptional regulator [Paenibacillus beijingensis]|uniref:Transcriptional regulator n=1 Tax=Paenibacillus beijingensis TaxID=1126833 RepID=A0A0D5NH88_9BACL|nr:MarR family transcriptional regulator [Paenibacillus beijingensis]AJY74616.1 transcriptional regulator [Paenibacillus beijingensis]
MNREGLDGSIGFLMGVTYRKLSHLLLQRLKDYDITPEQWSVLYRIQEMDGCIQKEIAERSGKDKPTTTRILDALEAKGLVRRKIGENDRRSFRITITDKGKELIRQTEPIEKKAVQDAAAGLSDGEIETLLRLLRHIGDNVDGLSGKE